MRLVIQAITLSDMICHPGCAELVPNVNFCLIFLDTVPLEKEVGQWPSQEGYLESQGRGLNHRPVLYQPCNPGKLLNLSGKHKRNQYCSTVLIGHCQKIR